MRSSSSSASRARTRTTLMALEGGSRMVELCGSRCGWVTDAAAGSREGAGRLGTLRTREERGAGCECGCCGRRFECAEGTRGASVRCSSRNDLSSAMRHSPRAASRLPFRVIPGSLTATARQQLVMPQRRGCSRCFESAPSCERPLVNPPAGLLWSVCCPSHFSDSSASKSG